MPETAQSPHLSPEDLGDAIPTETVGSFRNSEFIEGSQNVEELMVTYGFLMDYTTTKYQESFEELSTFEERELTDLLDPNAQTAQQAREKFNNTMRVGDSEIMELMNAASSTATRLLSTPDLLLLREATREIRTFPPESRNIKGILSKASNPLARSAISIALDAELFADARYNASVSDEITSEAVLGSISQASSSAASLGMRIALDDMVFRRAKDFAADFYPDLAEGVLLAASSPQVAATFKDYLRDVNDPNVAHTSSWYQESDSFKKNVGADEFIEDVLHDIFHINDSTTQHIFKDTKVTFNNTHAWRSRFFDEDQTTKEYFREDDNDFTYSAGYWSNFFHHVKEDESRKKADEEDFSHQTYSNKDSQHFYGINEDDMPPVVHVDDEVQDVIRKTTEGSRGYGWIASEDPGLIRDVIDDIHQARRDNPGLTDFQYYKQARMKIEKGQNSSDNIDLADNKDMAAFKIVDAMMGGNPREGKLPVDTKDIPMPEDENPHSDSDATHEEDLATKT